MRQKPTRVFWFAVFVTVCFLMGISLYRSGLLTVTETHVSRPGAPSASSANVLELAFYTSSAKKTWIEHMTSEFNEGGRKINGKSIRIKSYHIESGSSLDQMKDGKIQPDIWSPGDDSWVQLAASHWKNVKQKDLLGYQQPLVNIPLVIAMWEPMARALGYPDPIGWLDIERLAADPAGWAAHGHPEWGKFRWGHAHPDANSGFLAIMSQLYAVLGKTDQITVDDLKSDHVITMLGGFQRAIEHYGLSNSWIDDLMHARGPRYLSCAVQYENTIIESNAKHNNRPFKLMAIYPKEGNFWTRHPAVVIKEDWMTPEKEEAAQQFIDFLRSREAQTKAMQFGLRPILPDLELSAPFDADHGVIAHLPAGKQFTVPDDAVLKRIRDLWEDVKVPASVLLIIDRSGSMEGPPMDNAKLGAIQFIKNMKPRDQLMVVVFSNEVMTLTPLGLVRDVGEQAIASIQGIFAEGGTALYDVVSSSYTILAETMRNEPNRRYGLLVLTDGQDTSSVMKRQDFLDNLPHPEQYDVPKIYTIAYGPEADKDLLAEISNRSNARLFSSKPEEILSTYKELSANF